MNLNCGCGNIEVTWRKFSLPLVARRCGCDYCSSKCCEYISDPNSYVQFKVLNQSFYNVVRHGTETAEFHECTNCGLVLVTSEIEGALYSVLNAKVLNIAEYTTNQKVNNFSSEPVSIKLSRRKKNWCKTEIFT